MRTRDVKDFIYASFTFTGVLSLYALPMVAILASPDREVITSVQGPSVSRVAMFHLPEPEPVEEQAEVINHAPVDEGVDPEPEIINLSAGEPSSIPEPSPVVSEAPPEQSRTQRRRRRNRYRHCQDNAGIETTDAGYSVERSVVDHYAHITRYRKLGHVSWYRDDDGRKEGFKLRRIHCDLREAGIRNGDVVTSVNGKTVRSIPQAITLYWKIRRQSSVVLEILRRGTPITISYVLR
tara:strand:- start:1858 stop:2568 length:711 start_codon:yes stop_codon:yes gene_type:complete